jgi:hypothetical protein
MCIEGRRAPVQNILIENLAFEDTDTSATGIQIARKWIGEWQRNLPWPRWTRSNQL